MAGLNEASARLLQGSVQDTVNQIMQRKELEQRAQQAMRQAALEAQLRDVQEARYGAQAQHYAQTEANQTEAAKIHEANQQQMLKAADDKYNLSQHISDLESTTKNLQGSIGQLAQDVVAGKMTPDQASAYMKSSWGNLDPSIQQQVVAQNPKIQAAMDGNIDWPTAAKNYEMSQAGRGRAGEKDAVGIQYQNAAKTAQDELNAGQQDGESDQDWAARSGQLQQLVDLNMASAKSAAHLFPTQTKTETTTKPDTLTGKPAVSTSATTTSFGAPPPVPTGSPASANMPPARPAPIPQSQPNPQMPAASPSVQVSPATPVPANAMPLTNHISALMADPTLAPQFDAKYGPGSAAKYLNQTNAPAQ